MIACDWRPMEPRWIDDRQTALAGLIDELRDEPRYALDTEFHGERTLLAAPRARAGRVAGRDRADRPVRRRHDAVRRDPRRPGLMVAHAAEQDLAILERACGRLPDTALRHAGRGRLHRAWARRRSRRSWSGCSTCGSPRATASPTGRAGRCTSTSGCTRPPTSSTCSRCTTCSSRGSSRWAASSGRPTSARSAGCACAPGPSPSSRGGA